MSTKINVVSVVIPTYDRDSVFNAVESVLQQDYKSIEVVVVNDKPEDTIGVKLLDKYPNIKYFHDGINRGGGGARKKGVEISTGNYVSFLDDDDWYYKDKISFLLKMFGENPKADACFGTIVRSDLPYREPEWKFRKVSVLSDVGLLHTNTSLIKREVFDSICFNSFLKKFQDTYFHILLVSKFSVFLYGKPVSVWNVDNRDDQITRLVKPEDYKKSCQSYGAMVVALIGRDLGFFNSTYLVYRLVRNIMKSYLLIPLRYFLKGSI
jgi:glycosyltransferase involved in cell wall biosynthesis